MKLKVHNKEFNEYTQIDKFALVPKKMWEEIETGSQSLSINGKNVTVRVYDVPCDCTGAMHSHRLIDFRSVWDKLDLKANQDIEISRSGLDQNSKPDL